MTKVIQCSTKSNGTEIQQVRSHTSNIVQSGWWWPHDPEIWWTKSQFSLLNIDCRLSGCQSSLLLILFCYGSNACLHCTKVWHRTYPIFEATLRYRNCAKITVLMCEQNPHLVYGFRAGDHVTKKRRALGTRMAQELSGIVWAWAQVMFTITKPDSRTSVHTYKNGDWF